MAAKLFSVLLGAGPEAAGGLLEVLRRNAFEVRLEAPTEEVLASLEAGPRPQLVFCDVDALGSRWPEVVSRLAARLPEAAVIVTSRDFDASLYCHALQLGASDYIAPPYHDSDLKHIIRCVLARAERKRRPHWPAVAQAEPEAAALVNLRRVKHRSPFGPVALSKQE